MLAHDASPGAGFGSRQGPACCWRWAFCWGWGVGRSQQFTTVLLFSLHVEAGQFRLTAIEGRTGFMPDKPCSPVDTNDLYTLLLLDARGETRWRRSSLPWAGQSGGAPWADEPEAPHPVVRTAVRKQL
ncbi:hypothetical protein [Candidatus Amarolinea dominans]|uniref:hypothetical protein n=1 Tax=Candidatus Amarolinea dominans TaxID=3140696 RepID=UPI003135C080|nr:hypothetical protein [Anaerolineae bacterium]